MKYKLVETRFFVVNRDRMGGLEIERKADRASVYLQPGDDAGQNEADIERFLNRRKCMTAHDWEVLDHYLGQYTEVMELGE